jgi:tetratricopeptide (TPR) repeat protein
MNAFFLYLHRPFMRRGTYWVRWLFSVWFAGIALAGEPYIPTREDEVLERLPRSFSSSQREVAKLRQQLSRSPHDVELACEVARQFMGLGIAQGDPRFFGYARAALGPWWNAEQASSSILKIRAKLKEKEHLYDDAIADLSQILRGQPEDDQVLLEIANLYRVQGKFDLANEACDKLEAFAGVVPTTLARAPIQAATGQAEIAYESLQKILPEARSQFPTTVQWIITSQAQISAALGRAALAEQHFQEGLAAQPNDIYLLRSYGDFLLDTGKPKVALKVLQEHIRDTAILLGATIAARDSGDRSLTEEWVDQLATRFREARIRNDQTHGRLEARFVLKLQNDPNNALSIALKNWEQQKELSDARLVLEAALKAGNPSSVSSVLDFLEMSGMQDVHLQELTKKLEHK